MNVEPFVGVQVISRRRGGRSPRRVPGGIGGTAATRWSASTRTRVSSSAPATSAQAPTSASAPDPLAEPGRARMVADLGSASVLVVVWMLVLVMAGAAATVLTSALAARAAVASAADLGALAGATETLEGPDAACARAGAVVRANRATVVRCTTSGTDVWVVAEVPAPRGVAWLTPGRSPTLRARAHADLTAGAP